jgi:NAD(P)-dependent dehydrogenase (short-subunit alcohol dehydrogenase family)
MRFKDKTVVITGATTGIGRGTAILFGKEGAKVVVAGRREKEGQDTVKAITDAGGEAMFVATNIAKANEVESLIETAAKRYGSIDVLINNAGVAIIKPVHEFTEEEWDTIIDTHMKGTFLCSKYAIPYMIKQGEGAIVNTASIWSFNAYPGWAIYCAAKGGILQLTRAMAVDLAPYKIRVNCVCPGAVRTELMEKAFKESPDPAKTLKIFEDIHPMRRVGEPEDVGKAVLFLASDDASWITGADLSIDGGRKARDRSLHDIE